ncbi:MAG TPA: hypothetical protein VFU81_03135 [Thermomicrobiales bacterium]|nr:hypothetical protein [Thermomicrobiales bacterium]
MDGARIDGIACSLARVSTRRAALRLTAGTCAAFGAAGAADAKHRRKKKCKHGTIPCKGRCCPVGSVCIGGGCVSAQGTCADGDNACGGGGAVVCSNANSGSANCECLSRLQGGTRCVQFAHEKNVCGECQTDAACVKLGFPKGSSCVIAVGPGCLCSADAPGICAEPCGWVKTHAAGQTGAGSKG